MFDRDGRYPFFEPRERRERNHGLSLRADRGAGGRQAAAGVGKRVEVAIAGGVGGDRSGGPSPLRRRAGYGSGRRIARLHASRYAAGGADIDLIQCFRALPVSGRDLHLNAILVERSVDG